MTQLIDIIVRDGCQAYACRVGKLSGSSTSSARAAAELLAGKLFGAKVVSIIEVEELPARYGITRWRVCFNDD